MWYNQFILVPVGFKYSVTGRQKVMIKKTES